jgi:hypothetical protein
MELSFFSFAQHPSRVKISFQGVCVFLISAAARAKLALGVAVRSGGAQKF